MQFKLPRYRSQQGFSLVELLVVILILGILAMLITPKFLGQRDEAENSSAKSSLKNAATAALSWKLSHGERWVADDASNPGVNSDIMPLANGICEGEPTLIIATSDGSTCGNLGDLLLPLTDGAGACSFDFCTPGNDADPRRIFLSTVEQGKHAALLMCNVSKGNKYYCLILKGDQDQNQDYENSYVSEVGSLSKVFDMDANWIHTWGNDEPSP